MSSPRDARFSSRWPEALAGVVVGAVAVAVAELARRALSRGRSMVALAGDAVIRLMPGAWHPNAVQRP